MLFLMNVLLLAVLCFEDVPECVDCGKRSAGAVRGYELVAMFGFADNLSVYLVVDMHFFEEVLADVVE